MGSRKLRRGLTHDELQHAVLVSFRNADELLADAELLQVSKRFARAVFLSCIGLEELGKASLCLELYDGKYQFHAQSKVEEFWRFWRDHLSKTAHGQGYCAFDPAVLEPACRDLLPDGCRNWTEYEEKKRHFYAEYADLTTRIKEGALYVDFVDRSDQGKPSGFHLPSHVFGETHAERFVGELRDNVGALRAEIRRVGWLDVPHYPPDEFERLPE